MWRSGKIPIDEVRVFDAFKFTQISSHSCTLKSHFILVFFVLWFENFGVALVIVAISHHVDSAANSAFVSQICPAERDQVARLCLFMTKDFLKVKLFSACLLLLLQQTQRKLRRVLSAEWLSFSLSSYLSSTAIGATNRNWYSHYILGYKTIIIATIEQTLNFVD